MKNSHRYLDIILGTEKFAFRTQTGCERSICADKNHELFVAGKDTGVPAATEVTVNFSAPPENLLKHAATSEICFKHRSGWVLKKSDNGLIAELRIPAGNSDVERIALITDGECELYIPKSSAKPDNALAYTFTEVLWLATRQWRGGLLMHTACVKAGEKAYLFSGSSGSGKSTTASLWNDSGKGVVLGDESIMLWVDSDGKIRCSGTPWPGSAGFVSSASAEADGIFFIAHGEENEAKKLPPAQAAANILQHAFLPHWSKEALDNSSEIAQAMAEKLPVWEYRFLPEKSAVDFIYELVKAESVS